MAYPVVGEIWTIFEATLQVQAKRLVEDIAKHQKADPKELWAKIKPMIKIGILDSDLGDPMTCTHPSNCDGAIKMRCRAPCALGFDACPRHIGLAKMSMNFEKVDRVQDCTGQAYFVDKNNIVRDRNGCARGHVKDEVMYLFEI